MKITNKVLTTQITGELLEQDIIKILSDCGATPQDWQFYSIKLEVIGDYKNKLRFVLEKSERDESITR